MEMLSLQNANSPKARVLGARTKREDGSSQVERPQIRAAREPMLLTAEYPNEEPFFQSYYSVISRLLSRMGEEYPHNF